MDSLPKWVMDAHDLALGMAAANAYQKFRNYDVMRLSPEAFRHLEADPRFPLERTFWSIRAYRKGDFTYRADDALSVLNKVSCTSTGNDVWRSFERFGTPPALFIVQMCVEVAASLDNFEKIAISSKDLKEAGLRIRTLSLKLAEELSNPAIQTAIEEVRRTTRSPRMSSVPKAWECVALAELATGFQSVQKEIAQPNAPNAKRTYFIRRITKWIYKRTRTPMRSQVFSLAKVFFNMDDLTPQRLATIAPVRKPSDNPPVSGTEETAEE